MLHLFAGAGQKSCDTARGRLGGVTAGDYNGGFLGESEDEKKYNKLPEGHDVFVSQCVERQLSFLLL